MPEIWDIYDKCRRPTGRTVERGGQMNQGEYHIAVQAWIRNSRGEWLLSRRAPGKGYPLTWESTGGSALAGEDSLSAALREVQEELGIVLNPACGRLYSTTRFDDIDWDNRCFLDLYIFEHDCPIEAVRLQESETCGAMWADERTIRRMREEGELAPWSYQIPPFTPAGGQHEAH